MWDKGKRGRTGRVERLFGEGGVSAEAKRGKSNAETGQPCEREKRDIPEAILKGGVGAQQEWRKEGREGLAVGWGFIVRWVLVLQHRTIAARSSLLPLSPFSSRLPTCDIAGSAGNRGQTARVFDFHTLPRTWPWIFDDLSHVI